jgi:leader peptidase (prepilin peptidase) / N-methyltransferase
MVLIILFLLGISVGSFLNVLVERIPRDESFIRGRSHCDKCKHLLSSRDLIPLLSFIMLKGKCRYCGVKLSVQYPLMELFTGIMFLFIYVYLNWSSVVSSQFSVNSFIFLPTSFYIYIFMSSLLVIFVTDLKYRIIPDQILIFDIPVIFIYMLIYHQSLLVNHLLSGVILFVVFLALVLITKGKGMGLGDVKFAFVIGLLLGFEKTLIVFYLSFLTGALFSMILILVRKKRMKDAIPFGPFLAGSTAVAYLYGDKIWQIVRLYSGF